MLLINSISNTKKFFQKTIDSFKSFLSKGSSTYERLPKTPPFHPFSCGRNENDHKHIETGYKDLDNFYSEFTHQWDSQKGKLRIKPEKKSARKSTKQNQLFCPDPATINRQTKETNQEKNDRFPKGENDCTKESLKIKISNSANYQLMKQSELCSRSVREKRLSSVAEKLQELELMDTSNGEHKVDVEEILHYYSRLTCPAFLDIVDRFFKEICTEFYSSQVSRSPQVH